MLRRHTIIAPALAVVLVAAAMVAGSTQEAESAEPVPADRPWFQRTGTMPIHANTGPDVFGEAEIAAAAADGRTVVYTDGAGGRIGFATLGDTGTLAPAGVLAVAGRPTAVDVVGDLALVVVDTTVAVAKPSGVLQVVDLGTRKVVASHDLGGMPDLVDVADDGRYAAITIENEKNDAVNRGELPQYPGGFLAVVDLLGEPADWTVRRVSLTGLSWLYPSDPEPEHVSIGSNGLAAVTLQENNHVAIVDVAKGTVVRHFGAGVGTVSGLDTKTNGQIRFTGTVTAPREPEGVAWLDEGHLAIASEGDYHGGTRTWNVFDVKTGAMTYSSSNDLEFLAASYGQYPEHRAGGRGLEPEALATATYGDSRYLFVGLERANLVAVYDIDDLDELKLIQGLPVGVSVEGILPIPQHNSLVVVSKEDDAANEVRSSLTTFQLTSASLADELAGNRGAPTIVSDEDEEGGYPIGFGALSGLSGIPGHPAQVVAVNDDSYGPTQVFRLDIASLPARVMNYLPVMRRGLPMFYDAEGIAATADGGFWLAVEGAEGDENFLVQVDDVGRVVREIGLPKGIAKGGTDAGFEGVAVVRRGELEDVWASIQREWDDNTRGQTTLARYTPKTGEWAFAAYPLDRAPRGGWVGVSELTAVGDDTLLVLERDNLRGDRARIKKVTAVDLGTVEPVPAGAVKPVLAKKLVRDLIPALKAGGGIVADKPEGLAYVGSIAQARFGELIGVVDNDGVEDAPGETLMLRLGTYAPN